jgi:hypothetical protein
MKVRTDREKLGGKSKVPDVYVVKDQEAEKVIQNAMQDGVLFVLERHAWGNRKKLSNELAEELFGDKRGAIRAVQDLLDRKEIKDITDPQRDAWQYVRQNSLPWITKGVYFIRKGRKLEDGVYEGINRVVAYVKERIQESQSALDLFLTPNGDGLSPYRLAQKEFARTQPVLYREVIKAGGYPPGSVLRGKFRMRYYMRYLTLPAANGNLGLMTQEEAEAENQKWKEQIKETGETMIAMTRAAGAKLFQHLRTVLKDPDAKFKDSTVEKPKQFLAEIGSTTLFGDKPFEGWAKDASDLLDGVYGEDLRSDSEFRKVIGGALDGIVEEFENLPTVKLERRIDF